MPNGIQEIYLKFQTIKSIIINLNEENMSTSTPLIMGLYDINYPYSFNLVISQLIYTSFVSQKKDFNIYFQFMKEIEEKEEITKNDNKLINIFIALILKKYTQESFYLLEKFIELQYIKPKIVYKKSLNFLHYLKVKGIKNINFYLPFSGYYKQHYKKLSKNDWELHKQLLKKGVNPNEISKIIRNDEIEKLQDLSSQDDFNFNQTIEPSPYERCSFINKENVSLIDYAAYFSAVKCFKYLLMNGSNVNNTAKYAIAGGNLEIIHLCEQNHLSFKQTIDITIQYHINEVFHYLYENKLYEDMELELIQKKCIMYYNYEILLFLLEEGMKFSISFLNEFAKIGNMFILKPFIEEKLFPNDVLVYSSMSGNIELVKCILDQKVIDINSKNIAGNTALISASEYGHSEVVKLLLEQKGIDINTKNRQGFTAFMYASKNGHTEVVKLLLEQKGIDINMKNQWTSLMFASKNGHSEVVKLLLEQKGIDVNAKDREGWTAIKLASKNSHSEVVKLLGEHERIDINVKNDNGRTYLQ